MAERLHSSSVEARMGETIWISEGLEFRHIELPNRQTLGRVVVIDQNKVEPRVYVFYELVNASFDLSPKRNLGTSVFQMINSEASEAQNIPKNEVERLLFACNLLHTNYIRGNGFVLVNGILVSKPPDAIPLDGKSYQPLDGSYTALVVSPGPPEVRKIKIKQNSILGRKPYLAWSGPQIVANGENVAHLIPVRLSSYGQTVGNEINYLPQETRTSFTAFGVNKKGLLVSISVFTGNKETNQPVTFRANENQGVTLSELADVMCNLGIVNAIVGGGSGDTQQFIKTHGLWISTSRKQENRTQVEGIRGLGAILAVLKR